MQCAFRRRQANSHGNRHRARVRCRSRRRRSRSSRGVHGDLERLSCLMIGTGEMGELLAEALREAGLGRLFVTDTRAARAEAAARALGCHTLPFDGLADARPAADIILGCLGSRTPVVTADMARAALRKRRNRPIVFVDTAVPGDIDPLADRLDGVFLYSLDDLERLARDGRAARENEVEAARRIVDEESRRSCWRGPSGRRSRCSPGCAALRGARVRRWRMPAAMRRKRRGSWSIACCTIRSGDCARSRGAAARPIGELSRIDDMLKRLFDFADQDTERKP